MSRPDDTTEYSDLVKMFDGVAIDLIGKAGNGGTVTLGDFRGAVAPIVDAVFAAGLERAAEIAMARRHLNFGNSDTWRAGYETACIDAANEIRAEGDR